MKLCNTWLRNLLLVLFMWLWIPNSSVIAGEISLNDDVIVQFPDGWEAKANSIGKIFLKKKQDLTTYFGRDLPSPTTLILCNSRTSFEEAAGGDLPSATAAFAIASQHRIGIHVQVAEGHLHFKMANIIGHEIVHLIYWEFGLEAAQHRQGLRPDQPLWFNEGIASWIEGMDLRVDGNILNEAASSNTIIPFRDLQQSFPTTPTAMHLAYAQSESFVRFLNSQSYDRTIVRILQEYGKSGDFHESVRLATGGRLPDLIAEWDTRQPRSMLPIARKFLTLFKISMVSILVVIGWLQMRKKKKIVYERWEREEDDDDTSNVD